MICNSIMCDTTFNKPRAKWHTLIHWDLSLGLSGKRAYCSLNRSMSLSLGNTHTLTHRLCASSAQREFKIFQYKCIALRYVVKRELELFSFYQDFYRWCVCKPCAEFALYSFLSTVIKFDRHFHIGSIQMLHEWSLHQFAYDTTNVRGDNEYPYHGKIIYRNWFTI